MATKRYLLTTGNYDSYQIVGCVEGNARPALSTLRKRFYERYSVEIANSYTDSRAIYAQVIAVSNAEEQARRDGYEGMSLGELFRDWLIKEHGFVSVQLDEIWIVR